MTLEQFIKLDKFARGAVSDEEKVDFICKIFALSSPLYVDINQFLLLLRLFFSNRLSHSIEKERVFRGVADIFKAHGVVSSKRHLVSLSDLRTAMLRERSTTLLLFRLIFPSV